MEQQVQLWQSTSGADLTNLKSRSIVALNLKQYSQLNTPDKVGYLKLGVPLKRQYVLRILIKRMFGEYLIPDDLEWAIPFIQKSDQHQKNIGVQQPFVYLTIRNGITNSETDDDWHVDGFSQAITHLPEQNYIWSNVIPTEYVVKRFVFPKDFDSLKHNIHHFFQERIVNEDIAQMDQECVYGLDPYVVHRRPKTSNGVDRCFLRVSYTPIEIEDVNNTLNPLLPTYYVRDGVKEMRNQLASYDK